jgi:hypothetical protein
MAKVLLELLKTLKPRGVLFSSNPRGNNEEGLSDDRYACFFDLDTLARLRHLGPLRGGGPLLPPAGTAAA